MKHEKKYINILNTEIKPVEIRIIKNMVVNHHYKKEWPICKYGYYAFGIYYNSKIIGCLVYGLNDFELFNSITKTINFDKSQLTVLRRLWIEDGYGTNIESYSISQSLKYLKKIGIKIVITFAEDNHEHEGKIYQATNWLYQGIRKGTFHKYLYILDKKMKKNIIKDLTLPLKEYPKGEMWK